MPQSDCPVIDQSIDSQFKIDVCQMSFDVTKLNGSIKYNMHALVSLHMYLLMGIANN